MPTPQICEKISRLVKREDKSTEKDKNETVNNTLLLL